MTAEKDIFEAIKPVLEKQGSRYGWSHVVQAQGMISSLTVGDREVGFRLWHDSREGTGSIDLYRTVDGSVPSRLDRSMWVDATLYGQIFAAKPPPNISTAEQENLSSKVEYFMSNFDIYDGFFEHRTEAFRLAALLRRIQPHESDTTTLEELEDWWIDSADGFQRGQLRVEGGAISGTTAILHVQCMYGRLEAGTEYLLTPKETGGVDAQDMLVRVQSIRWQRLSFRSIYEHMRADLEVTGDAEKLEAEPGRHYHFTKAAQRVR